MKVGDAEESRGLGGIATGVNQAQLRAWWPAPPLQYTKIEVRISQGQLHSPKDPPSVYHTRGLNRAGGTIETRKSRKNETSSEQ